MACPWTSPRPVHLGLWSPRQHGHESTRGSEPGLGSFEVCAIYLSGMSILSS